MELTQVKAERDQLLAALRELKAAVQARWEAKARVAELHRERSIARPEQLSAIQECRCSEL